MTWKKTCQSHSCYQSGIILPKVTILPIISMLKDHIHVLLTLLLLLPAETWATTLLFHSKLLMFLNFHTSKSCKYFSNKYCISVVIYPKHRVLLFTCECECFCCTSLTSLQATTFLAWSNRFSSSHIQRQSLNHKCLITLCACTWLFALLPEISATIS